MTDEQNHIAYLESETVRLAERVKELETFIVLYDIYLMTEDGIQFGKRYMERTGYDLLAGLIKTKNVKDVIDAWEKSIK